MKKIIGALIIIALVNPLKIFSDDNNQLLGFIKGNVIPENVHHFGMSSVSELDNISFGSSIPMELIFNDKTNLSVTDKFSIESGEKYVPVLISGIVKFFIVIDKSNSPVSLGYKILADELAKIAKTYSINISDIKIYKSLTINSYLFSVPTLREANLTILMPNWEKQRAGLTPLNETLSYLRSLDGGVK